MHCVRFNRGPCSTFDSYTDIIVCNCLTESMHFVLGLTGGLAAPLIAAGTGAVLGASSAAVLGTTAGVAIIASLFGAAGAGLTGKMKLVIYHGTKNNLVHTTSLSFNAFM